MIRIISYILNHIIWNFIFNQIGRINFLNLFNAFRTHLLASSTVDIWRFLRDLFLNRITNNFIYRIITSTPGINPNLIVDTKAKRIFWISFVSTLILYRQYKLFKNLILWPFKLGIYSFIFSLSGIDMSWFLSWFNYFPGLTVNIPQWVYIQYLTLYSNWLNWWKGTVEIKNIKTESLPQIPKFNYDTDGLTTTEGDSNKWINKKNIIIGLSVIALIGIGIWYFYYSGPGAGNPNAGAGNPGGGGAGNVNPVFVPNPPAPNPSPIPHQISVIDNQTPDPVTVASHNPQPPLTQSNSLLNSIFGDSNPERLNQAELDRVRQARIEHLRHDRFENILNQDSLNTPSDTSTSVNRNVSTSTLDNIILSIDSTETNVPVNSDNIPSRIKRGLDKYFPINGENAIASGSGSGTLPSGESVESILEGPPPTEGPVNPTIVVTPASPIEPDLNNSLDQPTRPLSPTGSDDSSETIRPFIYGDPGERPRVALPREPFDHSNRRGN